MNNCKSPLKLTFSPQLFVGYKVNKPNIETCELVDKEIADELLKALQELLPLADDGYQSNCRTASHEEFLQEDRTLLFNAREAIKKAMS